MSKFNTIEEAIEDIRQGCMVIVVDDEDRENEGDLVMAAAKATPEAINFMARYGRGLICMPTEEDHLARLEIHPMVAQNTDLHQTAFTVSVDALETTTGISAHERSATILKMLDPEAQPTDFRRPGHVFPLAARSGGVLKRAGHTEAAVDLARMSGLPAAGVICEIMEEDGSMARVPSLFKFAGEHGLKMISIVDLIAYRRQFEQWVDHVVDTDLPTRYGDFRIHGYVDRITGEHHVALVKGTWEPDEPVLVRVHSECLTGDALGSMRCDCGEQYGAAMKKIEEAGNGVLLYMRQEGRGIGLINKLKAYALQDEGMDTVDANLALGFEADQRDYGIGAQILADLGVRRMRLMTNNPRKISGLAGYGIEVTERVPIQMNHNERNVRYLNCKRERLGHMLHQKEEKK